MERLKRWAKVEEYAMLGGVLAGLSYAIGVPTWVTRIAFFVLAGSTAIAEFLGCSLAGLYILLWIFMPAWVQTPADFLERTGGAIAEIEE